MLFALVMTWCQIWYKPFPEPVDDEVKCLFGELASVWAIVLNDTQCWSDVTTMLLQHQTVDAASHRLISMSSVA